MFGRIPVNAICAFRKLCGEGFVISPSCVLLTYRMTLIALRVCRTIVARGEDCLSIEDSLAVMTGTTVEPLLVTDPALND